MGAGVGVNDVPIVGQPVAYGTGFLVLVAVGLSTVIARYFYLLVAQGGHMLSATFLLRKIGGFRIKEGPASEGHWSPTSTIVNLSGYSAAPLLGLGGAALIAHGNAFASLFIAALFSALSIFVALNGLGRLIPALVVAGIFALGLYGDATQQATAAVALVWFLLISGVVEAFRIPVGVGDPEVLRRRFLLPGVFWKLIWILIAIFSLFVGGRLLLAPSI